MKISPPFAFLAALGLFTATPLVSSMRAGSAVAADGHGGYGYAYGPQPETELRRTAIHRCRDKSKYPDDVKIVIASASRGAGVIVRYSAGGRQHVYAYVGAENDQQASNYATGYVEGYGGTKIEVVARWRD